MTHLKYQVSKHEVPESERSLISPYLVSFSLSIGILPPPDSHLLHLPSSWNNTAIRPNKKAPTTIKPWAPLLYPHQHRAPRRARNQTRRPLSASAPLSRADPFPPVRPGNPSPRSVSLSAC